MGGDEFTIVISELTDRVEAMDIATLVLESLSEPFIIDGQEFSLTASIGISTYPDDGETAETLVRNADTAMYKAKEEGRNNFQIYTDAFNHAAVERVNLEQQLRKAIDKGEFLVRYQPQIEISSGRMIGTEALVRWQSPQLGLVSPADFIPLAEETGLIMAIGEFVMETACRQNKAWHDAGYSDIVVSVNMSARQFQNDSMLDWLSDILTTTGLDPCYLDLELTESILMKNPESMIEILQTLKDMNIGISIDDFGTGYSSLSYLKQFPVSALKIDRSFISNITTDPDDAAIARAVIAMAKSLNLKVIAEGVETLAQLSFLHELNCDLLQGYLISPPVAPEEIERMLRDENLLQAA
jgi:EAL domain-containing protein (putative c-di-GMP-specific phosphodiesterase class I)